MSQKKLTLFPGSASKLKQLGENLKLARLRRNISAKLEAERAGICLSTLSLIEKGSPSVSMGNYAQVLFTLNLDDDLLKVGADDELGRKLQDIQLQTRKRVPKGKKS